MRRWENSVATSFLSEKNVIQNSLGTGEANSEQSVLEGLSVSAIYNIFQKMQNQLESAVKRNSIATRVF